VAQVAFSKPVEDSVAKVNEEVAVGEDLAFQKKWWIFERWVWIVFTLILLLDLSGVFGRGPLAKAHRRTHDGAMDVRYERIARTGTPSTMSIAFGGNAIQNGKIRLFVSESVVKELGAQRVIPSPAEAAVGNGGLSYIFPASGPPATVEFVLQPSTFGIYRFTLRVEGSGSDSVNARVVVVP
jgi:hypothetical protein